MNIEGSSQGIHKKRKGKGTNIGDKENQCALHTRSHSEAHQILLERWGERS
jgi:hypothetical protein